MTQDKCLLESNLMKIQMTLSPKVRGFNIPPFYEKQLTGAVDYETPWISGKRTKFRKCTKYRKCAAKWPTIV